ncbi:Uncharacterised protein [Mycobacteroides abscessus subsp. abscessus]|nr:Uncharacterised protein [Mycobacteroides abscessus subsp. abscessus]
MRRDRSAPNRQWRDRPDCRHDTRGRGLRRGRIHRPLHRLPAVGHRAESTAATPGGVPGSVACGGGLRSQCPTVGRASWRSAPHRCRGGRLRASPHRRGPGRSGSCCGSSTFGRAERRGHFHLPRPRLYAGTTRGGRRTRITRARHGRCKPARPGDRSLGAQRRLHPDRRRSRRHRTHRGTPGRLPSRPDRGHGRGQQDPGRRPARLGHRFWSRDR